MRPFFRRHVRVLGQLHLQKFFCKGLPGGAVQSGEIGVSDLYQYEYNYRITKRGKISKNGKRRDCGSMEVSVAHCECGANWEQGDFEITEEGYFIDYKYRDKE